MLYFSRKFYLTQTVISSWLFPEVIDETFSRSHIIVKGVLISPSRKVFFCGLLRTKICDYVARFLKKYDGICRIFMNFYAMKLQELSKMAGTCKNCGLMKKRTKHPVLTRLLP